MRLHNTKAHNLAKDSDPKTQSRTMDSDQKRDPNPYSFNKNEN